MFFEGFMPIRKGFRATECLLLL